MLLRISHSQMRNSARSSRRHGLASVEMAFVAPVLLLLIFGSIDFGRAMMVSNLLTTTAREGARKACTPNTANSDITPIINNSLDAMGVPKTNAQTTIKVNGVTQDASSAKNGDTVTVQVTVPFNDVTWLPTSFFLKDATLRGIASMRRE